MQLVDKTVPESAATAAPTHLIAEMPLLEQRTETRPLKDWTETLDRRESQSAPSHAIRRTAAWAALHSPAWWKKAGVLLLYLLATVQFVGAYLYLEFPYVDRLQWEEGNALLPFQTRLLLAPLYRLFENSSFGIAYAQRLARNTYFFPTGVTPGLVLEFFIGIACVLLSGWVAVRIYNAASRSHLLRPVVYPLFLSMCVLLYIVHTVQNFRYMYDLPSLAFFSAGFYLIYFRKPTAWFALLFTIATLNRETTLLLLPFWALSQSLDYDGRVRWRGLFAPRVLSTLGALSVYWLVWHHVVFNIFGANPSEYYPRALFNLHCFLRLRYWPQLACAFAFLWPLLPFYRKQVHDAQLRAWMLVLPLWYAFMFTWAVLTETRVFAELLPFLAPVAAIMAEEVFAAKVLAKTLSEEMEVPRFHRGSRAA